MLLRHANDKLYDLENEDQMVLVRKTWSTNAGTTVQIAWFYEARLRRNAPRWYGTNGSRRRVWVNSSGGYCDRGLKDEILERHDFGPDDDYDVLDRSKCCHTFTPHAEPA